MWVCDARDVSERIHDDEPDTSGPVGRSLLEVECPQWAQSPIEYLKTSGTDNAMWRIRVDDGPDMVIRLPRRPGAAAGVLHDSAVLQQIERTPIGSTVNTPKLRRVGEPHDVFPHRWTVLDWISGSDAWTLRHRLDGQPLGALGVRRGQDAGARSAVSASRRTVSVSATLRLRTRRRRSIESI